MYGQFMYVHRRQEKSLWYELKGMATKCSWGSGWGDISVRLREQQFEKVVGSFCFSSGGKVKKE